MQVKQLIEKLQKSLELGAISKEDEVLFYGSEKPYYVTDILVPTCEFEKVNIDYDKAVLMFADNPLENSELEYDEDKVDSNDDLFKIENGDNIESDIAIKING